MDDTGEQLHPNWRALATVHIPLKRFIKEGWSEAQKEMRKSNEKYEILQHNGDDVKVFYEDLVRMEENNQASSQNFIKGTQIKLAQKNCNCRPTQVIPKTDFELKRYFRYAMENKLEELKRIDFEGQNLNVCDNYGWSALMMASCEGAYDAVEFLLTLGVDRNIKDKTGKTATDFAYKKGHLNIVDLLQKDYSDFESETSDPEHVGIEHEPFYCEICKQKFEETSKNQHYTSTVHKFHIKASSSVNKLQKFNIPSRNKGLKLMVKQGWDKESGLGPSQSGRLYPVKTVIRKQRTGLGIEQNTPRVTHFGSYDYKAVQSHSSAFYKKKARNRNDIKREKIREWKRDRRLRNELN